MQNFLQGVYKPKTIWYDLDVVKYKEVNEGIEFEVPPKGETNNKRSFK